MLPEPTVNIGPQFLRHKADKLLQVSYCPVAYDLFEVIFDLRLWTISNRSCKQLGRWREIYVNYSLLFFGKADRTFCKDEDLIDFRNCVVIFLLPHYIVKPYGEP